MRRPKSGASTVLEAPVEGEDGGTAGAGGWEAGASDDSGTMRRNAASQLNQIGAEIQLTAAVRKQDFPTAVTAFQMEGQKVSCLQFLGSEKRSPGKNYSVSAGCRISDSCTG